MDRIGCDNTMNDGPPNIVEDHNDEEAWRKLFRLTKEIEILIDSSIKNHYLKVHNHKGHKVEDYHTEFIQSMLLEFRNSIKIIQGKFTIEILFVLHGIGTIYFNQIKNALPTINATSLTNRLKELESNGMILREVEDGTPVRVKYSLTDLGKSIFLLTYPILFRIQTYDKGLKQEESNNKL
jgi:DNA-binding HxlR family transcriptional regulator